MMTPTYTTTGDAFRAAAAQKEQAAHDSFERCDTDGFLSQWALGVCASRDRLSAEIADNGGVWEFPALFRNGVLVAAKLVTTRYGRKWGVLTNDNPQSAIVEWFTPTDRAAARRGYTIGTVLAPAVAYLEDNGGRGRSGQVWAAVRRTDGGFSRDVRVVATSCA